MLLTLNASCLRSQLVPAAGSAPALALSDLPQYTREVLGLGGLNLTTDLLVGADRRKLEQLRERADRAGCPCLLLIEAEPQKLGATDAATAEAVIGRMLRVIEAAQILSCTAAALRITADDSDAALQVVWPRLRKIVDRAERLELNLLVSPMKGLTAKAERVTDMIKKVGGFRIGTLPDFQFAFESTGSMEGAVTFLRRITPYASVVQASTTDFADPSPDSAPPKPPAKRARPADDDEELEKAAKKAARSPEPPEEIEAPAPTKGKKKGKDSAKAADAPKPGKTKADAKAPKAEAPPAPAAEEPDEEIEELDDASLEDLIADIFKSEGEEPPPPQEPLPVHKAYDLFKMVHAVASVGFDSTIAVDYRGGGDVTLGIRKSQRVLRAALDHAAMSA
jgi:sugar phosphate isomerase/epimerase